ncbi:MAG TPA: hypothetical protein VLB04_01540 [Methanotrichaceae archaeon]|nr:hypothetical protein [Methanotrichaceae archaeon]
MEALANASSPEPTVGDKAISAPTTSPQWDPGPDLKPLSRLQRLVSVLKYAWQSYCIEIIIMISVLLAIIVGVLYWDELRPPIPFQNQSTMPSLISSNLA